MASLTKKGNSCKSNLAEVPFEKGFHFCKEGGRYTGVTATSLCDFATKLEEIDDECISFHLRRRDFERWIRGMFCDEELAWKVRQINAADEKSRQLLIDAVNSHINFVLSV